MTKRPANAGYKRSWKNYLLNARYQLRFTGVLVAVCVLLLAAMGWWIDDIGDLVDKRWPSVMSEAESATKVGETTIKGATLDFTDPARDEALRAEKIAALRDRQAHLEWVLIGAVVLLSGGLFVFGILMTHKVAGPLYKIGLYLDKVKNGKFDKVYNLRKGDQLVEFFEHFKQAHESLRQMQERDVAQLKEVIAAAEKHETLGKSPLLEELRAVLESKEASLG